MRYDLLVVGGGVLGTFHAYHAAKKGLKVAILEKNDLPRGSSVQNFGQIVPSGMDAKWQAYGRQSLDVYKQIQAEFDISVRQNGSVYIASNEEEIQLLEELAVIVAERDYPAQMLSPYACLTRYEGLRKDYCKGGLFFPEEITLEPRIALPRIHQYLKEQKQLAIFYRTLVVDIVAHTDYCTVNTSDKRHFEADQVLVCSGYEFQALFPDIYLQSDLVAVKLQMLLLEAQKTQRLPGSILTGLSIRRYESFSECPSYAAIKAKEAPDSLAKKWGVHILFKQATDGSVILGDSHEYAPAAEAETLGTALRTDINDFMLAEAAHIFNFETWAVREAWAGVYTQCRHRDIFQTTLEGRIHLLTGIGGKGMTASAGFAYENILNII
jgi:FAD dependent oxidoreductase TIGR03364